MSSISKLYVPEEPITMEVELPFKKNLVPSGDFISNLVIGKYPEKALPFVSLALLIVEG